MGMRLTRKKIPFGRLLVLLAFGYAPLSGYVSGVFLRIPLLCYAASYILPVCIIIVALLDYKELLSAINARDVLYLCTLILIVLFSWFLNEANRTNIESNVASLFLEAIPFYFVGLIFKPSDRMFDELYYLSCFSIAVCVSYFVLYIAGTPEFDYEMGMSYSILMPVLLCIWYTTKNQHRFALFFSILGSIYLLFLGTRGPVVILAAFSGILLWLNSGRRARFLIITAIAAFFYIYLATDWIYTIAFSLKEFAAVKGFSVRIFDFIINNSLITNTSGRDKFYQIISEAIWQHPLRGYGIYGDWLFVNNPAHRIWLEIWCHYGLLFGSLLMLTLADVLVKGYKACASKDMKYFLLIWAVHLLVRGIFGSSYLAYYSFFLLGLCINQIRTYRHQCQLQVSSV